MTLVCAQLAFGYRRPEAVLRGVDCALAGGRVTAIVGPNAAGKSTLLRLLAGLHAPWSGEVTLGGVSVRGMGSRQRAARIAYVAQRSIVGASFTAAEVVRLGRYALPERPESVDGALALMDLAAQRDRLFAELSAGQQQRVSLARALAQLDAGGGSGCALLVDEPTSALDPRHAIDTMRALRGAAARGVAVGVAVHDLTMAARYADDAVVLAEGGRVAASGTADTTLAPGVLEGVFGVGFVRIGSDAGDAIVPMERVAPAEPAGGA